MKKHVLSWGLILSLVLTMLPVSVQAAEHNHSGWTALSGNIATLSNGNYYLDGNLNGDNPVRVTGTVTLCLNGCTLEMGDTITVGSGAVLTLCDCGAEGKITGAVTNRQSLISVEGGTLNVSGGTISGTASSSSTMIAVTSGGTFIVLHLHRQPHHPCC